MMETFAVEPLDPYRAWDIVARLRDEIETLRRERDEARGTLAELHERQMKLVTDLAAEREAWIKADLAEAKASRERDAAIARAEKAEQGRDEALKRYGDCVIEKTEERRNYVVAVNERDDLRTLLREAGEALERIAAIDYERPDARDVLAAIDAVLAKIKEH